MRLNEKTNWAALRNQAAIAAMQGLLSNASLVDPAWDFRVNVEKTAVALADALIAELKNEQEKIKNEQEKIKLGFNIKFPNFIPVGGTFEFEGKRFLCVDAKDGCTGCAFYEKDCEKTPPCSCSRRDDEKDVIFKKLEENKD